MERKLKLKIENNMLMNKENIKKYIEENKFKQSKVEYKFQNFNHPIYKQRYPGFESNMSFIDLLFNHGNNSIKIIKQI